MTYVISLCDICCDFVVLGLDEGREEEQAGESKLFCLFPRASLFGPSAARPPDGGESLTALRKKRHRPAAKFAIHIKSQSPKTHPVYTTTRFCLRDQRVIQPALGCLLGLTVHLRLTFFFSASDSQMYSTVTAASLRPVRIFSS